MLSFFLRGVLDEILNLIESVSEGFPSYSFKGSVSDKFSVFQTMLQIVLHWHCLEIYLKKQLFIKCFKFVHEYS